jgi:hypothetical protein
MDPAAVAWYVFSRTLMYLYLFSILESPNLIRLVQGHVRHNLCVCHGDSPRLYRLK